MLELIDRLYTRTERGLNLRSENSTVDANHGCDEVLKLNISGPCVPRLELLHQDSAKKSLIWSYTKSAFSLALSEVKHQNIHKVPPP
jgi:hypothetical protein